MFCKRATLINCHLFAINCSADVRELISEGDYYRNIFSLAKKSTYKLRERAGCTKKGQFCRRSIFQDVKQTTRAIERI